MTTPPVPDAWNEGQSYERYMGRWSREMATLFVDWLGQPPGQDWADVGCGTGALSTTILARAEPRSVTGVDPSASFIEHAARTHADTRARFEVFTAENLGFAGGSFDVVASALAYNFFPDRPAALAEMRRVARPGGVVAFYVWDYPGGGMEFIEAFWQAAMTLDPAAAEHDEGLRFPFCTPEGLTNEVKASGIAEVEVSPLSVQIRFESFDDFWEPFTLGVGPAPAYYDSLDTAAQVALRELLEQRHDRGGAIEFNLRAWAVRGRAISQGS
jgi:SAM-dependent methyltransferase